MLTEDLEQNEMQTIIERVSIVALSPGDTIFFKIREGMQWARVGRMQKIANDMFKPMGIACVFLSPDIEIERVGRDQAAMDQEVEEEPLVPEEYEDDEENV